MSPYDNITINNINNILLKLMELSAKSRSINQRTKVCPLCNQRKPIAYFINIYTLLLNDLCSGCISSPIIKSRIISSEWVVDSSVVLRSKKEAEVIPCVPQSHWIELKSSKKSKNVFTARFIYHRLYSYSKY